MKSNLRPSDFKLCLVCLLQSTFHAPANCFLTQRTVWQAQNILESLVLYISAQRAPPPPPFVHSDVIYQLFPPPARGLLVLEFTRSSGGLSKHIIPPLLLLHVCIRAPMHLYVLSLTRHTSPHSSMSALKLPCGFHPDVNWRHFSASNCSRWRDDFLLSFCC